jgi:hypothetical protein
MCAYVVVRRDMQKRFRLSVKIYSGKLKGTGLTKLNNSKTVQESFNLENYIFLIFYLEKVSASPWLSSAS